VGLSLALHMAAFVLGLCLMTAGFFALHAVCSGLVGKESGPHKAQATSIYLLAYYIGSSVLGYAGGWLWGHGGWPWLSGGLLAALAVFMVLLRTLDRQPETMLMGARPEAALSDALNAK
jgi:MFS transporter, YNFM family, putative membrane transport protein